MRHFYNRIQGRQSWDLGGRHPQILGRGSWESRGGREGLVDEL